MSYLNSVSLIGFVGSDPEQRQARNNGAKFTVFSIATQRSWKNAEDEWVSKTEWHRIAVFRPRLAEHVLNTMKRGAHVLVEGSLVSSTYEQPNGKGKKSRPQRSLRGRSAPMSCANSTAASPSRRHQRPSRMPQSRQPKLATPLLTSASWHWPSGIAGGPFACWFRCVSPPRRSVTSDALPNSRGVPVGVAPVICFLRPWTEALPCGLAGNGCSPGNTASTRKCD